MADTITKWIPLIRLFWTGFIYFIAGYQLLSWYSDQEVMNNFKQTLFGLVIVILCGIVLFIIVRISVILHDRATEETEEPEDTPQIGIRNKDWNFDINQDSVQWYKEDKKQSW